MIRAFQIFAVMGCIFWVTCAAHAGYVLELTDGAEIVVSDYWREEGEIRYPRYGGVVGIPAREVRDIRPTDQQSHESGERPTRATRLVPREEPPGGEVETIEVQTEESPESPVRDSPEEMRYMEEFETLKERFKDLSSMSEEGMLAFSKKLTEFRRKIISLKLSHVYKKQLLEIYDMGEKLEAAYDQQYQ